MTELLFHRYLAYFVFVVAAATFIALFFVVAPYGRHTRKGWGPEIPARIGWMVMESPSALGFLVIFLLGTHRSEPVPIALAAMWLAHYLHRSYIFPFRQRGGHKPMPASVALMAIFFNCINAYLNARWISELGAYDGSWFADPRFIVGVVMFAGGMALNLHSDEVLFNLRKPGEHGYKIPYGGGYALVSAPNYLGELIEWAGWAIASWSIGGVAFAVFTAANLVPRAISNHRWYKETFPEYPAKRRAVIPWLV